MVVTTQTGRLMSSGALCRSELQAYTKTKTDEIVNLNNTISRLKKQLETYEAESYAQETKKDYSLQVASQKTLEYGQVMQLSTTSMPCSHVTLRLRSTSSSSIGIATIPQASTVKTVGRNWPAVILWLSMCMQVCMSTDNLFQRCRQRSKVAHGNVTNPLLQLEAIGNFVSDLGAIKELAQKTSVKSNMQPMPKIDKLSVAGDK